MPSDSITGKLKDGQNWNEPAKLEIKPRHEKTNSYATLLLNSLKMSGERTNARGERREKGVDRE